MALLVSLRLTWCSTKRRLRLSIAAVSLPDSAADLSDRILLCRLVSAVVFDLNSCRDASCSLWNATNLFSTSALRISSELLSLPLLLSLSLLLSLPLSPSPSPSLSLLVPLPLGLLWSKLVASLFLLPVTVV